MKIIQTNQSIVFPLKDGDSFEFRVNGKKVK